MTLARPPRLYTAREVAARFGVDQKTVGRWGREGRMGAARTPGRHWRFNAALVDETHQQQTAPDVLDLDLTGADLWAGAIRYGLTPRFHAVEDPQQHPPRAVCSLEPLRPDTLRLAAAVPQLRYCRRPGCLRMWHNAAAGVGAGQGGGL